MNSTGIVRKIDDLGRIVLPKELRKSMNINSGDDFQIILNDNKIILEKYSKLKNYEEELLKITECFSQVLNYKIYVVINNKVLNNKETLNNKIINIIRERKIFISDSDIKNEVLLNIEDAGKYVINPIVLNSDLLGAIIVVGKDKIDNLINTSKIIINIIKSNILN